ncbi:hypothetical protein G9A89_021512 [Geosiphon pyriformis]|nr:hypothetical protein G9A89_021512 [Geosiphon pyriformis]
MRPFSKPFLSWRQLRAPTPHLTYGFNTLRCSTLSVQFPIGTPLKRWHRTHVSGKGDHTHLDLAELHSGGTRITLIGLGANVGLTVSKGIAGWLMNSASLIADAGHSLSDLISDFITLYTFRASRKPPDSLHPYGYGKYETVGSLGVSSLLILGAIGIGHHSYEILMDVIPQNTPVHLNQIFELSANISNEINQGSKLNPNAAWFAAASVLIKEALYRSTLKVALETRSDVLVANAWHHRSDAASSLVALGAIGGSYLGFPFLDPLGGILVAGMIMKNGIEIMISSLKELVDARVEEDIIQQVENAVLKFKENDPNVRNLHSIRGRKSGPFNLIDMVLQVPPDISVSRARQVEERVRNAIKNECKNVTEVMIHLDVEEPKTHH